MNIDTIRWYRTSDSHGKELGDRFTQAAVVAHVAYEADIAYPAERMQHLLMSEGDREIDRDIHFSDIWACPALVVLIVVYKVGVSSSTVGFNLALLR